MLTLSLPKSVILNEARLGITKTAAPVPASVQNAPITAANRVVLNFNWTAAGKVTSVKNQGGCGSCYAFAVISDIESTFLLKRNVMLDLSEQQIVDCTNSPSIGNYGCDGGFFDQTFRYIIDNGVTIESNYPYTGVASACKLANEPFKVTSYSNLKTYNCVAMANRVKTRPVVTAVAAGNQYFMYYSKGVLSTCGTGIDHAVQVTGVYQDRRTNYWIVKNSWGTSWGENGYIRISRRARANNIVGNLCDICSYPEYSNLL